MPKDKDKGSAVRGFYVDTPTDKGTADDVKQVTTKRAEDRAHYTALGAGGWTDSKLRKPGRRSR